MHSSAFSCTWCSIVVPIAVSLLVHNVHFQAIQPTKLSAEIQGAMITEYFSSYAFKADCININTALFTSATLLQKQTKTPEQASKSVLARAMNRITGSMTLGAIYVAHLLLGRGDSYLSYKTQILDFKAYVRWLWPDHAHHLFSGSSSYGSTAHTMAVQSDSGQVVLVNEVQAYKFRNAALSPLSPMELAMGFVLERNPKNSPRPLSLKSEHPQCHTHSHKRRPNPVVAQFVANHPPRPADSASDNEKEAYAAYALSVFYSDRLVQDLGEMGGTLWEKLSAWALHRPRGDLDELGLGMLGNAELQAAARLAMSQESANLRMSRKMKKKATAGPDADEEQDGSDEDDEEERHDKGGRNDGLDEEFEVGGDAAADAQMLQQHQDHLDSDEGPSSVAYALQNLPPICLENMSREASCDTVRTIECISNDDALSLSAKQGVIFMLLRGRVTNPRHPFLPYRASHTSHQACPCPTLTTLSGKLCPAALQTRARLEFSAS